MYAVANSYRNSPSLVDPSSVSLLGRCKDLNHFPPSQTVHFQTEAYTIQTVGNDVTGETLLAYVGEHCVQIVSIKLKDAKRRPNEDAKRRTIEDGDGRGPLTFDFTTLHTAVMRCEKGSAIRAFAMSPEGCLTVPPYKLRYAVARMDGKSIYVYDHSEDDPVDKHVELNKEANMDDDEYESKVTRISTDHAVTKMALEKNRFLGGILANKTLAIWDLELPDESGETKLLTFPLKSDGVHIAWHSSDKYAVAVVEAGGWIKFFNIYKQICYLSVSLNRGGPLYSADWATLNPLLIAAGSSGMFTVINSTSLNSNCHSVFETPQENITGIKFNPADDRVVATLARVPGILRLWKSTINNVWTYQNSELRDIAWIHGKPYVAALGFRCLYIFDGSCL